MKGYANTMNNRIISVYDEDGIALEKIRDFECGENAHQKASLYKVPNMADYEVLYGDELSYTDISDLTTAVDIVSEFFDVNAVSIVKNSSPCGVALGKDITDAYSKAFDCDPISAIGGVIALSQPLSAEIAKMITSVYIRVIIAPDFDAKAIKLLENKQNVKLVKLNTPLKTYKKIISEEIEVTPFGVLVQDKNKKELNKDTFKIVTKKKPTAEQIEDAIFAWKVVKYAKTNAIVIAHDFKTIAIGQGHANSVSAFEWALDFACDGSKDAVAASDSSFIAVNNIHASVQGRVGLIIQPGGSVNDKAVIDEADKYDIAMITTCIGHVNH
jgi:phosphoribosylaminoimidazolecarboxamide formyltransferase/IMP cyclohydrolase